MSENKLVDLSFEFVEEIVNLVDSIQAPKSSYQKNKLTKEAKMNEIDLLKRTPEELVDMGICPTCLNRKYNGAIYGNLTDKMLYVDEEIEGVFVFNPRAKGHMCISTIEHYHDLSEALDHINEKIIRFTKQFMIILRDVYQCERVYFCSMCDGPMNHYHVQLIPRYDYEQRGSKNFVKSRTEYVFDKVRFLAVKDRISKYAESYEQ